MGEMMLDGVEEDYRSLYSLAIVSAIEQATPSQLAQAVANATYEPTGCWLLAPAETC